MENLIKMKTEFDSNLIPYHKIFQNEKIFNIYERTKQNNVYLPEYWKQLDLFTWNMTGMALLLGLDKLDRFEKYENMFRFYFLVEERNEPNSLLQLYTFVTPPENTFKYINGEKIYKATKPFNSIISVRIKSLRNEIIVNEDYTIKRFLNNFSVIDDWESKF